MRVGRSPLGRFCVAWALFVALTLAFMSGAEASPILVEVGDSPADMARQAAIKDDEGVKDSEDTKKVSTDAKAKDLNHLQQSLKDAAVAVAEKASQVAAAEAMEPGLAKLKAVITQREGVEKSEVAAKALAVAAHDEVLKDRKVAVAALKAETSAAKAKGTLNQAKAAQLRDRLANQRNAAKIGSERKAKAVKRKKGTIYQAAARALEKRMAAKAQTAEHKEAEAQAAAARASLELRQAAILKGQALQLKKRRGTLSLAKSQALVEEADAVLAHDVEEDDWANAY